MPCQANSIPGIIYEPQSAKSNPQHSWDTHIHPHAHIQTHKHIVRSDPLVGQGFEYGTKDLKQGSQLPKYMKCVLISCTICLALLYLFEVILLAVYIFISIMPFWSHFIRVILSSSFPINAMFSGINVIINIYTL